MKVWPDEHPVYYPSSLVKMQSWWRCNLATESKARILRGAIGLMLLFFVIWQLAEAQGGGSIEKGQIQTVNFCDLTKYPDRFDGKTVQVSATYSSDLEGAIFFDDNCKKSETQPDVIAKAKFIGNSAEEKKSLNQLKKAFNKRFVAPHVARVTMIAVFRDSYPPGKDLICVNCPRYTLEVKRYLDVEKVKLPETTPRN